MSLPFNIDSNWRIAATDDRNYTLQERKMREPEGGGDKYEAWEDKGHYGNIGHVCRAWAQIAVKRSDKKLPTALAEVVKKLDEVLEAITLATKEL